MRRKYTLALPLALFVAACGAALGTTTTVKGAGDDLLKLRAGPSLEYKVIMGLPDGTELRRLNCVTELGQRWCHVALVDAKGVTGFVSADYLADQW